MLQKFYRLNMEQALVQHLELLVFIVVCGWLTHWIVQTSVPLLG